jgi:SAM-dependent methyltransferase
MSKSTMMLFDPKLGPAWPSLPWAPAPRYLLRRDRVLRHVVKLPPGRVLEAGCGVGALLHELGRMGHEAHGFETSTAALHLAARANAAEDESHRIFLHDTVGRDWRDSFDTMIAMEVLEHIEDDQAALAQWHGWLKPGGVMLLSVPAHMRRWSAADEWAGHVRRYERSDLEEKLSAAGFTVQTIECYGFPVGNILDRFSKRQYAARVLRREDGTPDRQANNDRSGIDRGPAIMKAYRWLSSPVGKLALGLATATQGLFVKGDIGTGFVAVARKS